MMSRTLLSGIALTLMGVVAPAAAQYIDPDTCSVADYECRQARKQRDDKRAAEEQSRQIRNERDRQRRALLKAPPLPAERNVLLGSWRLEGGGQRSDGTDLGLLKEFLSNPTKLLCSVSFGSGITFAPSSYSISGLPQALGGPIAYRSAAKQIIVAIPNDNSAMAFEITSPDRIVSHDGDCVLVRRGASAANAPTNTTQTRSPAAQPAGAAGAVVDGAAFRCADGRLLHVSMCQSANDTCKLTELHLPGVQLGSLVPRVEIAARVRGCEAGGIRYGADDKPIFVR